MRTTKKVAAATIMRAVELITSDWDGAWEDQPTDTLTAVGLLLGLAGEFESGDPRGRKAHAPAASRLPLVGGEQDLFRA